MGLDLEMCVVPREFENILSKARTNAEYSEWVASTQRILSDEDFPTYNDPLIKQLKRDVLELKKFYDYEAEDFFHEQGRESSTLDYIFDKFIDEFEIDLPQQILWYGGERCEGCQSGQGMTLTLYNSAQIENINSLFQMLTEDDILRKYDYEKMSGEGVYKLTHPDHTYVLTQSFGGLKSLFLRAAQNNALILRNIY